MVITYHGVESFKIQFGETVIAYNPISKSSEFKRANYGADIVMVSLNHPDMNGVENASRGDKAPFVVSGPGEYELGGITIRGFLSKSSYGGVERINTIYLLSMEGMNLCFLGALASPESLSLETKETIDGIDVLFIPIGGSGVLNPEQAYKLAVNLEPALSIPMHYGEGLNETALRTFLKEGGEEKIEREEKLTLKKKDLEGKEGEIIVLQAAL
ncbi:hypothetical protein EPN83_00265 [Patescibacteria group bacterium]|nr:MAG: hypothetical protein EPN83_00265 [Patescibacteria group bacterium]